MKKILAFISLVLVFVMLTTITASAAISTSVLNNPNYSKTIDGIKYIEKDSKEFGSSTRQIFYGEYNTTTKDAKYEWVIHSIKVGTTTTLATVMNIAKDYEAKTGRKVMLAVNGDYFSGSENVESYVNDGLVFKKGNFATKHCIGFDNNGKVVIGRMTETDVALVTYDANGNKQLFKIDKFNQQPKEGEIALYNTSGTFTVTNAGVMVVNTDSANLSAYPVWGTEQTLIGRGVKDSKSFTLKSGQYAIVYTSTHNDIFSNYKKGDAHLYETPAGAYEGCDWVVGGYDMLVNNYTVNTNCHTDNSGSSYRARTFIGFKEDGTGFVCVVDEIGGSTGITVNQEAQLASALGAKYALELDGGGSSTMIVRINDTLTLRNSPSDGSMRKVSNVVLLVEKAEEIETPDDPGNNETPEDPGNTETPNEPGNTETPNEPDNTETPGDNNDNNVETPDNNDNTDNDVTNNKGNKTEELSFFEKIWQAILNFLKNLFGIE